MEPAVLVEALEPTELEETEQSSTEETESLASVERCSYFANNTAGEDFRC